MVLRSGGAAVRVQVAAVGAGALGEDGDEGDDEEEGEQEFHVRILAAGLDKSNLMWCNE